MQGPVPINTPNQNQPVQPGQVQYTFEQFNQGAPYPNIQQPVLTNEIKPPVNASIPAQNTATPATPMATGGPTDTEIKDTQEIPLPTAKPELLNVGQALWEVVFWPFDALVIAPEPVTPNPSPTI